MHKLVLIDGHAILHRAYHALPPLTNAQGQQMNAVFGFLSTLLKINSELHPTHLIVVFDLPAPTFRKELYKDYQAKRPKMEDSLASQIELVHQVLEKLEVAQFSYPGFEADDIIGTITGKIEKEKKAEMIIVTGDRDLLQLVNEKIKVYMPVGGLTGGKVFNSKDVEEKFAVTPHQIIDYKALIGDASDNYPGVPGIGPKTAAGLLKRFSTLENIFSNLNKIENKKVRSKLKSHKESAVLAKTLATIRNDVPVEIVFDNCKSPDFFSPQTVWILEEYKFKSLVKRIEEAREKLKEAKKTEKKDNNPKHKQTSLF